MTDYIPAVLIDDSQQIDFQGRIFHVDAAEWEDGKYYASVEVDGANCCLVMKKNVMPLVFPEDPAA